MKNPENRPLEIVSKGNHHYVDDATYALVLSNLAIAESNLIRAGKDSAMPHFLAIVKELEHLLDFQFEILE